MRPNPKSISQHHPDMARLNRPQAHTLHPNHNLPHKPFLPVPVTTPEHLFHTYHSILDEALEAFEALVALATTTVWVCTCESTQHKSQPSFPHETAQVYIIQSLLWQAPLQNNTCQKESTRKQRTLAARRTAEGAKVAWIDIVWSVLSIK